MRRFLKLFLCLFVCLAGLFCVDVFAAGLGDKLQGGGLLAAIGAAGGTVGGGLALLLVLPKAIRLIRVCKDLLEELKEFVEKYRDGLPSGMAKDVRRILQKAEILTETAADIAAYFKRKKWERALRGLITERMLK